MSDSIVANLLAKRDEIASQTTLKLAIPHWPEDQRIVVEYGWIDQKDIGKAQRKADGLKGDKRAEAIVEGNAQLIAKACRGVYLQTLEETKGMGPDGLVTCFDEDLAAALGLSDDRAVALVRKLFFTDGDIAHHAGRIVQFSGYTESDIEADLSGE